MIRSDRLFLGTIVFILSFIFIVVVFNIAYLYDYLTFWWILLTPYVAIKLFFPNSKILDWFHSVPKKVLYFYESTYDKIKIF